MALIKYKDRKSESGQTTIEYALLIALLMGFFVILMNFVKESQIVERLARPLVEEFQKTYQYGHPNVKGFDDRGGPENHPRASNNANNFRIFIYRD